MAGSVVETAEPGRRGPASSPPTVKTRGMSQSTDFGARSMGHLQKALPFEWRSTRATSSRRDRRQRGKRRDGQNRAGKMWRQARIAVANS